MLLGVPFERLSGRLVVQERSERSEMAGLGDVDREDPVALDLGRCRIESDAELLPGLVGNSGTLERLPGLALKALLHLAGRDDPCFRRRIAFAAACSEGDGGHAGEHEYEYGGVLHVPEA